MICKFRRHRNKIIFYALVALITYGLIFTSEKILNYKFKELNVLFFERKNDRSLALTGLLNDLQAIVIDLDLLDDIYNDKTYQFKHSLDYTREVFIKRLFNEKRTIVFGVVLDNFKNDSFIELVKKHHLHCTKVKVMGKLEDSSYFDGVNSVVTSVFISCDDYTIQLAFMYRRGKNEPFLWIGRNEKSNYKPKWFNDEPRAMNFMKTQEFELFTGYSRKYAIRIPKDYRRFLYDYKHSKFYECDRKLAESLRKRLKGYEQNQEILKEIGPRLKYISNTLEDKYKECWLSGGTLLGWYRDCGMIPHTQDCDIDAWAHEYDDTIKRTFIGNKFVYIWAVHGIKEAGLEFRMSGGGFTYDLILAYKHNATTQWDAMHFNKCYFQQFLPLVKNLCSGELLGRKFLVPCKPKEYLMVQYGETWNRPEVSNYTKPMVNWAKKIDWEESVVPYSIRLFYDNGTFNAKATLEKINSFYPNETKHFKSLPTDILDKHI